MDAVQTAFGRANDKEGQFLLYVLTHDEGRDKYQALVSPRGGKSPRSYVPQPLRRHLNSYPAGRTNEPEGVIAEMGSLVEGGA